MSKTTSNALVISLFLLYLFQFFHLSIYPYEAFGRGRAFVFFLLPILLLYRKNILGSNFIGKKLFFLYFLLMCLNIISCYYFREQSPLVSLFAWTNLLYVFYYFTFRTWNQSIVVWERVIEYVYVVLLVLFALKNAFIDWDFIVTDLIEERLEVEKRVRIFSDAFLELGFLFSLNKYLVFRKTRFLLYTLLGALFIFLQGFRIMIFVGAIVSFFMIIRVYKLSLRSVLTVIFTTSFIVSIALTVAMQMPIVRDRLEELIDRNEESNFNNEDYVRVIDINFTYSDFFKNNVELVLGAGRTSVINLYYTNDKVEYSSKYSKYRSMLATYNHYYPADLGFLGLSWESGIPFTIVTIILFLYLLKFKVEKEYFYAGCYGLFMILIGGTNAQGYYHSNMVCLALVYTIVELANKSFIRKNPLNDVHTITNK